MKFKKKNISILSLIFIFIFSNINPRIRCNVNSWTQTWTNDFDYALDIAIDSNDSIYVIGFTENYDNRNDINVTLLKYNTSGNLIWTKIWKREEFKLSWQLVLAIDKYDNLYIAGDKNLIKCDSNGNILWNVSYVGFTLDFISLTIEIDSFDNIYLASKKNINNKIFIAKFNSSGSQLTNISWGTIEPVEYADIKIDNLDNLYVLTNPKYSANNYLIKLNSTGNELWNTTFIDDYGLDHKALALDLNNNIYTVSERILLKFNNSGDIIWNRANDFIGCEELTVDLNGDIYSVETKLGRGPIIDNTCLDGITFILTCWSIFVKKYNSSGSFLWEKRLNTCSSYTAEGIVFDSMNNIYICGTLVLDHSATRRWDIILFKNPSHVRECVRICYDVIILQITLIVIFSSSIIIIPIYFRKWKFRKKNH